MIKVISIQSRKNPNINAINKTTITTGVWGIRNFKTGTSNVHSTGYECTNVNATGVITATSFVGSGANLTGLSKQITIGVRSGAAVTFAVTGSSFNGVGRSGNIPISI